MCPLQLRTDMIVARRQEHLHVHHFTLSPTIVCKSGSSYRDRWQTFTERAMIEWKCYIQTMYIFSRCSAHLHNPLIILPGGHSLPFLTPLDSVTPWTYIHSLTVIHTSLTSFIYSCCLPPEQGTRYHRSHTSLGSLTCGRVLPKSFCVQRKMWWKENKSTF